MHLSTDRISRNTRECRLRTRLLRHRFRIHRWEGKCRYPGILWGPTSRSRVAREIINARVLRHISLLQVLNRCRLHSDTAGSSLSTTALPFTLAGRVCPSCSSQSTRSDELLQCNSRKFQNSRSLLVTGHFVLFLPNALQESARIFRKV